jgi:hypothetical protein
MVSNSFTQLEVTRARPQIRYVFTQPVRHHPHLALAISNQRSTPVPRSPRAALSRAVVSSQAHAPPHMPMERVSAYDTRCAPNVCHVRVALKMRMLEDAPLWVRAVSSLADEEV